MLRFTTLEERRVRADVIKLFKIVNGIEGLQINHFLDLSGISSKREHSLKYYKKRDLTGEYTFGYRAVDEWNLLPEEIASCKSLNAFK